MLVCALNAIKKNNIKYIKSQSNYAVTMCNSSAAIYIQHKCSLIQV